MSWSKEYAAISDYYGSKTTKRSNVLLMNHIDEGIDILKRCYASDAAKAAYCLHPIFQNDNDLVANLEMIKHFDPYVIMLTMEYRRTANAYLCRPETDGFTITDIKNAVGLLLPEVRHMLIADKQQNFKDFMLYHYDTHKRSSYLYQYFKNWNEFLQVND